MCFIHTPAWGELIKIIMATPKGKIRQDGDWQCPQCTLHNSNEVDCCLACFTHRNDQPTSSSSAHEPCGPVKFIKEDLSVHSLMKGRAVYWNCPTCNGRLESSVVRCTLCGFVRTNSYADESEGQGIGGRLKNWLGKVGIELIDTGAVWRCGVCSVENQGEAMVCCSCGNERGAHGDAKRFNTGHQRPAPEIFPRPSFSRHSFTTSHQQRQQKPAPEIPPPPKFSIEAQRGREVWICPECTYENSLACSHCTMCNTSKGKITYSQPHIEY